MNGKKSKGYSAPPAPGAESAGTSVAASSPTRSLLCVQAVTFLHPGSGQSGGFIDQPVQREVHTTLPMIAGSGVKGALRAHFEDLLRKGLTGAATGEEIKLLFGAEKGDEGAGALAFTDARLLALPVRSMNRVFVWVTSPMVLRRLTRDLVLCGQVVPPPGVPSVSEGQYFGPNFGRLVLEEFAFTRVAVVDENKVTQTRDLLSALATDDFDANGWVVISDEEFRYLCEHATQVMARNKLGDNKTTNTKDGGNFWYEETLPPETLLYSLVFAEKPRIDTDCGMTAEQVHARLWDVLALHPFVQIGGNETVGQGWCRVKRYSEPLPAVGKGADHGRK